MLLPVSEVVRLLLVVAADLAASPTLRGETWKLLIDISEAVAAHRSATGDDPPPGWIQAGGELYPDLPSNLIPCDTPGGDGIAG